MSDNKPDNKSGIPPTTIGRERARYAEMRALDTVTDAEVDATQELDAKRYGVTIEDYRADIDAQPAKRAGGGKRDADKATRDLLIVETQDTLGPVNLAILSARGELEKELTTQQKARAFDALGVSAQTLTDHLGTCFDGIRGMSMIWSPYDTALLGVYIGGWEDGSKNLRFQYSPRKVPISKRSGYRDDSFSTPVYGRKVDTVESADVESHESAQDDAQDGDNEGDSE